MVGLIPPAPPPTIGKDEACDDMAKLPIECEKLVLVFTFAGGIVVSDDGVCTGTEAVVLVLAIKVDLIAVHNSFGVASNESKYVSAASKDWR